MKLKKTKRTAKARADSLQRLVRRLEAENIMLKNYNGQLDKHRSGLARELGTDDICILMAWQRIAIRLGELWNQHIRLAKQHGDIGFIREQETVAELRQLCATLPPNDQAEL